MNRRDFFKGTLAASLLAPFAAFTKQENLPKKYRVECLYEGTNISFAASANFRTLNEACEFIEDHVKTRFVNNYPNGLFYDVFYEDDEKIGPLFAHKAHYWYKKNQPEFPVIHWKKI